MAACSTWGLVGAIQHPEDGYIQPNDLTQALAKGARALGAEIYRQTAAIGLNSYQMIVGLLQLIKVKSNVILLFHAQEILSGKQEKWLD